MGEAQIDRQRDDVHAEWRAVLQARGYRRQGLRRRSTDNARHNVPLGSPGGAPPAGQSCRNDRAIPDRHLSARIGNAAQAAAFAVTVSSGWQLKGRPPPLRPRLPVRGPTRLPCSAWFGFCPFDGGRLELSGVFDGSPSLASSAITRAVRLCTCAHSAPDQVVPSQRRSVAA